MSFPKLEVAATCRSCGNAPSQCDCSKQSQSTIPMQSLPKPTTPLNAETVPDKYAPSSGVLWSGAENPDLGIYPGDSLTKIINILLGGNTGGNGGGGGTVVNVLDGDPLMIDSTLGSIFNIDMVGSRNVGNPVSGYDGQQITFRIKQVNDSVGFGLTWGNNYRFSETWPLAAITLSKLAGTIDYIHFRYTAADNKWDCIGYMFGYK